MAQNMAYLQQLGYSVNDVLNLDQGLFDSFASNYGSVLNSYYANDELMSGNLAALTDEWGIVTGDYLETTQHFIDGINALNLEDTLSGIESSTDPLITFADGTGTLGVNMGIVGENAKVAAPFLSDIKVTTTDMGSIADDAATGYFKLAEGIDAAAAATQNLQKAAEGGATVSSGNGLGGNKTGKGGYSGTAYASGKWNASSKGLNGESLVGELGRELVVHSNGTYETVGDNGAEFADIKSSDIVFNHRQTEELLENGHINSRGKAYAGGKDNLVPLSSANPEMFKMLTAFTTLETSVDKLDLSLTGISRQLDTMTKVANTNVLNNNVNTNPVINVNNPTFTCTGVTGEEVLRQIENSFTGLFTNAYQHSLTK